MTERIAVIIPCFNHARFVGEAIDSALGQSRKPDRVIVIDDGSRDESAEVLRSWGARGVEVYAQENQGAHSTLNKLVDLAATDCEWVAILNSDDRYLGERLRACLEFARQQPGKAVIVSALRVIDEAGAVMPEDAPRSRWFHGAWSLGTHDGIGIPEWLGQANFVATSSNIVARAAYLKANPFRPYRFNHDYFFLATAMLENQLAVCRETLLEYRVHGSNTIATRPEPLIREMLRMHLDLYKRHASMLRSSPELRKRFYAFARNGWDNISSFHAGLFQTALAQLTAKHDDGDLEEIAGLVQGPEFGEFPNQVLAASFDGITPLAAAGTLQRRLDEIRVEQERLKADREALDKLSRFRHKMLRSTWVRIGLLTGLCYPLVSNRGKKPHEKMLWLRDACAVSLWLRLGERLGSGSARELRRGEV